MKHKIEQLMTTWCKHHCIIMNVTNKNNTVCLAKQGFALEQVQSDPETEWILIHWIDWTGVKRA